jgi:hypothetical protein
MVKAKPVRFRLWFSGERLVSRSVVRPISPLRSRRGFKPPLAMSISSTDALKALNFAVTSGLVSMACWTAVAMGELLWPKAALQANARRPRLNMFFFMVGCAIN